MSMYCRLSGGCASTAVTAVHSQGWATPSSERPQSANPPVTCRFHPSGSQTAFILRSCPLLLFSQWGMAGASTSMASDVCQLGIEATSEGPSLVPSEENLAANEARAPRSLILAGSLGKYPRYLQGTSMYFMVIYPTAIGLPPCCLALSPSHLPCQPASVQTEHPTDCVWSSNWSHRSHPPR